MQHGVVRFEVLYDQLVRKCHGICYVTCVGLTSSTQAFGGHPFGGRPFGASMSLMGYSVHVSVHLVVSAVCAELSRGVISNPVHVSMHFLNCRVLLAVEDCHR